MSGVIDSDFATSPIHLKLALTSNLLAPAVRCGARKMPVASTVTGAVAAG